MFQFISKSSFNCIQQIKRQRLHDRLIVANMRKIFFLHDKHFLPQRLSRSEMSKIIFDNLFFFLTRAKSLCNKNKIIVIIDEASEKNIIFFASYSNHFNLLIIGEICNKNMRIITFFLCLDIF